MTLPKLVKPVVAAVLGLLVLLAAASVALPYITGTAGGPVAGQEATGTYAGPASLGIPATAGGTVSDASKGTDIAPLAPGATAADHGLKVLRTGDLVLEAPDPAVTGERLRALAVRYGGFIEDESFTAGDAPSGYGVYRVPAADYDAFVADARKEGTVRSLDIRASDQTKAYADLKTQLSTVEGELSAVRGLLSRARTVKDVLEIRAQTRELRSEADQLRSSLTTIDDQVSYATLAVRVQSPAAVRGEDFWGRNTLQSLVTVFQGSIRAIVLLLAALLPWLLLGGAGMAVWAGFRRFRRPRG